jgi:hypothetical protein
MYINNYLSLQKRYSFREKLSDTYFHDLADFYIAALVRTKGHIAAARNYYSSTRDDLIFNTWKIFTVCKTYRSRFYKHN